MQDPSKGADGLPQKGFAKKDEVGKERQNHHGTTAERGQASSLVNAGFRAPRVEKKGKT